MIVRVVVVPFGLTVTPFIVSRLSVDSDSTVSSWLSLSRWWSRGTETAKLIQCNPIVVSPISIHFGIAMLCITNDRMSNRIGMSSDLMRPTR